MYRGLPENHVTFDQVVKALILARYACQILCSQSLGPHSFVTVDHEELINWLLMHFRATVRTQAGTLYGYNYCIDKVNNNWL